MPEVQKLSRIAKNPVLLPEEVTVQIVDHEVIIKGPKGELKFALHPLVIVKHEDQQLHIQMRQSNRCARAQAGTTRSLLQNMVTGVTQAFKKHLELIGVGYRAKVEEKTLILSLGFSHAIHYPFPQGVDITVTIVDSITVVILESIDKQKVGQAAAIIRAFRPPEPYKGKGVRYQGEDILRKEVNKK